MLQRVFKAFQYRDFRLMWIGACTSTTGSWMQTVAQSWLVYTLSKDNPFFLGLDGFLAQIPIMLFSLLGGVMADRSDRRTVLLGSQYVQMTTALTLAALVYFHVEKVWHILVLVVHRRLGAELRRPGLFRADPVAGPEGATHQCHCIELHPIQSGSDHRTGAGRPGAGLLGRRTGASD